MQNEPEDSRGRSSPTQTLRRSTSCNAPSRRSANCGQRGLEGSAAIGARNLPIRVLVERRRPHPAIEASGKARADRTRWSRNRPHLTGVPVIIDVSAPLMLMLFAARSVGWRDHQNHHRYCRINGQCRKSDRKFAHAFLPSRPRMTLLSH